MKTNNTSALLLALLFLSLASSVFAQGTAFTYQGRLNDGGGPASGIYDLRFTIHDLASGDNALSEPLTNSAIPVSNGLFTVTLDFGSGVFVGAHRWLEVSVRTNGGVDFTTLAPRQAITPSPYAIFAGGVNAAGINGGIPAGQLVGVVAESQVPANIARLNPVNTAQQAIGVPVVTSGFITSANVTFGGSGYTEPPVVTVNASSGSGAAITSTISNGGVVALAIQNPGSGYSSDATLTIGAPPSNAFQTFAGENIFSGTNLFSGLTTLTNPNNAFAGNFTGDGGGLTNVNVTTLGGVSASGFWKLTGNSVAPGQFLGSTNFEAVDVRVNRLRGWRIEPDPRVNGLSANLIGGFINNRIEQPNSGGNVIAGGGWVSGVNIIRSNTSGAFIGAGSENRIGPNMNDGVIGGGYGNNIQSMNSFIGSGHFNTILPASRNSSIVGGDFNTISVNSSNSSIGGGLNNTNSSSHSHIGGGEGNFIIQSTAGHSTISGGYFNLSSNGVTVVSGGSGNVAGGYGAVVSGGSDNHSLGHWAVLGGGEYNRSLASFGVVGGGLGNSASGDYATVSGGSANLNSGFAGSIGGGSDNRVTGEGATVSGGVFNEARGHYSSISGGFLNRVEPGGTYTSVGGGFSNVSAATHSTIGGGLRNTIHTNAWASVISGGARNIIQPFAQYSFIGGGDINLIETNATDSFIGGGLANTIRSRASYSSIVGGFNNYIWADTVAATVAGGQNNFVRTNADYASMGGGQNNTVAPNATHATIPGGFQNTAAAPFSFAAGNRASALHQGAFVWADSQGVEFASTAANQFIIRAAGGVGIGTTSPQTALHVRGNNAQLRLEDPTFNNHWNIYTEALGSPETSGNLLFVPGPGGVFAYIRRGDGNYFSGSDARLKKDIHRLEGILDRVLQLRPVSYRFKSAPATASSALGLIAQEVKPLFPEVVDEHEGMKSVAYSGLIPVALGAIQELNQKVEKQLKEKDAEIQELKRSMAELKDLLNTLNRQQNTGAR